MYRIEDSNFDEFKEICEQSFEAGEPANCENYTFKKLVCDDGDLCAIGHIYDDFGDGYKTYIVGAFSKLSVKHVRVLVEIGDKYLDSISLYPAEILVENKNKRFERFAEFFGFKKTLARVTENDIIYTKYIRIPKCSRQQ